MSVNQRVLDVLMTKNILHMQNILCFMVLHGSFEMPECKSVRAHERGKKIEKKNGCVRDYNKDGYR